MPFMANGDLLSYIRDEANVLTITDLSKFALQVAKGISLEL